MIIDLEVWKNVIGYEGIYEISCRGDLRRIKTQKILTGGIAGAGYVKADLWKNGKRYQTYIHRLVAQAFIGLIDGFEINHIDGNKLNNRVNNLEIVTKSENEKHSRNVLRNLCKPVIATDLETGMETRYNSIMEASKNGFHESSIYKCCYGKLNKHKQKTWRFENPVHATRQKLKTHPHQWQGLTDDEIVDWFEECFGHDEISETTMWFAKRLVDAIKEKNYVN